MARAKLDETKALIKKTERPYEPHVPMTAIWDEGESWELPEYVGVFKKGDIVGYHCRNADIAWLEKEIEAKRKA